MFSLDKDVARTDSEIFWGSMNSKMTRNSSQQWKSKILKQNPWRSPAYWLAFHASLSLLSSTTQEHTDDTGHNGLGLSTWILPSRKCCHRFAHRPIWVRRFFIWDLRFLLPRCQTDKKKKILSTHISSGGFGSDLCSESSSLPWVHTSS